MAPKTRSLAPLLASLAFTLCSLPVHAQITVDKPIPSVATIRVDAGQSAGTPIPRTIFGSFLEPIGNSTYNGLWAGLLENPASKRECGTLRTWSRC